MDENELLLTASQSAQQFSVALWNYNTLNCHKFYKNGGIIGPKCLGIIGQDYILAAELGKPLLHVWPLNSQDRSKNVRLILPEPALCLSLCPKSIYLAAGIGCKLYIWQLTSGKLLSVQQKNFQPINSIKFSSDGEYLLVGGQDGMLIAYNFGDLIGISNNFLTQSDIGQVEPIYTKHDHAMAIEDIHIGNFGKKSRFATVSKDYTCRIYTLSDGQEVFSLILGRQLTAVLFDAPCWKLFVGNVEGDITQYSLTNSPRMTSHHIDDNQSLTFKGHKAKIICIAINISNTILASGSEDNFVYIWDIRTRRHNRVIEHKSPITNIKFVPAYQNFFAENFKPHIILKNLERGADLGNNNLTIAQTQDHDIDLSDDENSVEKEHYKTEILRENIKLRVVNRQLYGAALQISKKYNLIENN